MALGGGTGLPVVLRGLKRSLADVASLTAIVTVSDDGGSSGRLRRDLNVLAMGDIRNCLVALSENEPLMSRLFQYRYPGRKGLAGHSAGNLILTALAACSRSWLKAIETSGEVLAIRGKILPATLANIVLRARLENGRRISGESRISRSTSRIVDITTDPPRPAPAPGVLTALREADLIVIGPGSLFTSILPNLLVRGVADEIARSRAARVLVGNLMTQPGETDEFNSADHLEAIASIAGNGLFDYYLGNSCAIRSLLRRRYAADKARQVRVERRPIERLGVVPVIRDLLSQDPALLKIRHHEGKLTRALLSIARRHQGIRATPRAPRVGRAPRRPRISRASRTTRAA